MRFFRNPQDLSAWVKELGAKKAATILVNIQKVGNAHLADVVETTKRIVEANDDNAANVLFGILKSSGIAESDVKSTEKGVENVEVADELLSSKVITQEEHKQMVKQAQIMRQPGQYDMPLRLCPKLPWSVGKKLISTYNCRHYCLDGIVLDDDPMRVYCGELLWRRHIADKFSHDYQDRKTGELVGGYINERFYRFPDAGTPSNPEVPRDGGNPMMLKPGERTRVPRPHQWSTERRMQEAREKGSTTDNKLGKTAMSGWVGRMVVAEGEYVADEETKAVALADQIGGQTWHSGGNIWVVIKELPNGHVLSVTDDLVAEYASKDDLYAGRGSIKTKPVQGNPADAVKEMQKEVYAQSSLHIKTETPHSQRTGKMGETGLCPICGKLCEIVGTTKDGRLIGKCQNEGTEAFTLKQWQQSDDYEKEATAKCNLSVEAKKKGKKVNPWAVCHTTVDKDKNPEKYERCVMDVKEDHPVKESSEEVAKKVIMANSRSSFIKIASEEISDTEDSKVITAFSMSVDLKNSGVADEDAVIKVSETTGMPIEKVACIQALAFKKMATHTSDAYVMEQKIKEDKVQETAAEVGLIEPEATEKDKKGDVK